MSTKLQPAAEQLRAAYEEGPIPPLREVLEPTDATGAYQIQAINTKYWQDQDVVSSAGK